MAVKRERGGTALDFEDFPGRSDIQISRIFETARGDKLRAIVTTGERIILTRVAAPSGNTVILTGDVEPSETDTVVYSRVWDSIAGIVGEIAKGLIKSGGDGMICTSETIVETDAKTGKTTVTIKTVCKPA